MAISGIDVSEYQGNINWPTVANSGITFGFVKATEGVYSSDPLFLKNWAGLKSVGLVRGAYHFFVAKKDPIAQAKNFLTLTQKLLEASDLPPVLDLENTYDIEPNIVLDRAGVWLDTIEAATGRRPIIYTFPSFWDEQLGTTRLGHYPLWIAHFEVDRPTLPGGWKNWLFHQYTESGSVAGIKGPVDRNYFNGSLDHLQGLLKARIPLRQGYAGKVVMELQRSLHIKGGDVGTIDGNFGSKTKAAVINFQKIVGLDVDGIVGTKTWAALLAVAPGPPQPPTTSTLVNVCKSYQALAHQNKALTWLEQQLSKPILNEFIMQWRQTNSVSGPLSLINVCKNYRSLPHQDQALKALQLKLNQATIQVFLQRWRQS